jgi:hypothetical protein
MTDAAIRRRKPTTEGSASDLSAGAVLAIIEHIDAKVSELKKDILAVIAEGRVVHTKEHNDQQLTCQHSMEPLQTWYTQERRKADDRNARARPLVRTAVWVTNHWVVAIGIVSGIVALLYRIGVLHP